MPSPAVSKFTFRKMLRGFAGNRRGSAAIEFVLVAPLFFGLLFAIIETAIMFMASQVLETMTQNSARSILTGQAQSGGVTACQSAPGVAAVCTAATFKSYVCSQIPALFDCTKLYVDVASFSSFSTVTLPSHVDASKNFDGITGYSPGGPGDIVVVRLFYEWPIFVTGLGYKLSNLASDKRLLVATAAFKNEPYASTTP